MPANIRNPLTPTRSENYALSRDDWDALQQIYKDYGSQPYQYETALTDWEHAYLASTLNRYERFQGNTLFTEKQWRRFKIIEGKMYK